VKDQDSALLDAEQHAADPIAWKIASHLPQAVTHRTAKRHSDWPSVLNSHQILSNSVPISLIQRTQPISHHFGPGWRAVENDRNLARPVSAHADLYI